MQSAATIHLHKAERNCQMGIRAGGVNASVLPVRFVVSKLRSRTKTKTAYNFEE